MASRSSPVDLSRRIDATGARQVNKHFHIWSGRFAYLAGVVQCYRGLELVASDDALLFSPGDGLDLEVRSFTLPSAARLLVNVDGAVVGRRQHFVLGGDSVSSHFSTRKNVPFTRQQMPIYNTWPPLLGAPSLHSVIDAPKIVRNTFHGRCKVVFLCFARLSCLICRNELPFAQTVVKSVVEM